MYADQDWIMSFGKFTEGFDLVIVDGLADQFFGSVCIPQLGGVVGGMFFTVVSPA
jgi:hypothetical protein